MEDVRCYSLDSFFFLRFLFYMFNVTLYFCYLKFKFWGGFPSKISFWMSRMSHENGPMSWLAFLYMFWHFYMTYKVYIYVYYIYMYICIFNKWFLWSARYLIAIHTSWDKLECLTGLSIIVKISSSTTVRKTMGLL